ncbi:MAG TPA: trypsin-like peptidase domain-containing protein [Acidimicrobiales bacterium]|nr:trypsin-like peptidase domain-containing protein [Acidimicrobiales bacterium]
MSDERSPVAGSGATDEPDGRQTPELAEPLAGAGSAWAEWAPPAASFAPALVFTPAPPPPPPPPPQVGAGASSQGGGRRGLRSLPLVAAFVATAVISGGGGAAIALALDNDAATAASGKDALPASAPDQGVATGGLNVEAIAARVDKATVDITATGPDGQDEGTGMILNASGVVLTNNHVVAGSTELRAQIDGAGRTYSATVIGVDVTQDVALVRLQHGPSFPAVSIGDSRAMAVGDQVVAIGNALDLPGPETVTSGIISAVSRSITVSDPATGTTESLTGMFQTSAAISSGNSGGPLVDAAGRVIAMNTAAASASGTETASDVGFAIPINRAIAIARQIEAGKASSDVEIGEQPATGFGVTSVACAEGFGGCLPLGFAAFGINPFDGAGVYQAPVAKGAVVSGVEPGTPAAAAGLAVGDVIVTSDGSAITSPEQLGSLVSRSRVGARLRLGWVEPDGSREVGEVQLVAAPTP